MASNEAKEVINPLHHSIADKVDPSFAEIYNKYQTTRLRADQVPYEIYNQDRPAYTFPVEHVAGPFPEVASNEIYKIPVSNPPGEVEIQVYIPTPDAVARGGLERDGRLPALVNYHGGGFVIGGLLPDRSLCRQIAQGVGCIVLNADYRMAPDYPHPTSALDSWEALKWVFREAEKFKIDPKRVAVTGQSAGGCLAAVLALMARDEKDMPPLALQLLVVPLVDVRYVPMEGSCTEGPYESYRTLEFAPSLPLARLVWFYNLWLGTDEHREKKANDWRASPLLAESHANLAPASIRCAEVDPLVSEGKAYHEKLRESGTESKIKVYMGQGHPFPHWDGANPASREFIEDCMNDLREAFSK